MEEEIKKEESQEEKKDAPSCPRKAPGQNDGY